jgi:Domain of unknown function (DUF4145)
MERTDSVRHAMLLNAFDVDPGVAERTLELQQGELFALDLQVDVLVVSAWRGIYEPVPGTLVERLQQACGLKLGALPRQFDLSGGPIGAWISPPLAGLMPAPRWPQGSATRFLRIAVVESERQSGLEQETPWPVFRQLFSLLALLPLQGIAAPVVAAPLLGAGNQKVAPERLFPDLLSSCRSGFRHVPDLERLIIFDQQGEPLQELADLIDQQLGRFPGDRERVSLDGLEGLRSDLLALLKGLVRCHPQLEAHADVSELAHLLTAAEVSPVALGMQGRRLVEILVNQRLGWRRGSLYRAIRELSRQEIHPWIITCLHQVRVFGNWMVHPASPTQRKSVSQDDIGAMLTALVCVLEGYPW